MFETTLGHPIPHTMSEPATPLVVPRGGELYVDAQEQLIDTDDMEMGELSGEWLFVHCPTLASSSSFSSSPPTRHKDPFFSASYPDASPSWATDKQIRLPRHRPSPDPSRPKHNRPRSPRPAHRSPLPCPPKQSGS